MSSCPRTDCTASVDSVEVGAGRGIASVKVGAGRGTASVEIGAGHGIAESVIATSIAPGIVAAIGTPIGSAGAVNGANATTVVAGPNLTQATQAEAGVDVALCLANAIGAPTGASTAGVTDATGKHNRRQKKNI